MKYILFCSLPFILFSCGSKHAELRSKDPKSTATVRLSAEKGTSFDPFLVNIEVSSNELKETIGTEIFASQLDSTNVHFEWQQPGMCLIKFKQQDDTERTILAVVLEDKIGLKELTTTP